VGGWQGKVGSQRKRRKGAKVIRSLFTSSFFFFFLIQQQQAKIKINVHLLPLNALAVTRVF